MPRTKSFSSSLATIRDLSLKIAETVEAVQDGFDKLSADSKRLKEIEPALLKLQNAINPPTVPATPPETPTGESPTTEQAISDQPNKPKRQRAKKAASDGTDTGTE